ncbi:unnamed protein product [Discula destructiva]
MGMHNSGSFGAQGITTANPGNFNKQSLGKPHWRVATEEKAASDMTFIRIIIGGNPQIITIPRPYPPPSPRPGPRPGPIYPGPAPDVPTPPATPRRPAAAQVNPTWENMSATSPRINTLPRPQPPPSPRPGPRPGPVPYPPPGVPTPPPSP